MVRGAKIWVNLVQRMPTAIDRISQGREWDEQEICTSRLFSVADTVYMSAASGHGRRSPVVKKASERE